MDDRRVRTREERSAIVIRPASFDELSLDQLLDVLDQLESLQRAVLRRLRERHVSGVDLGGDETLLTVTEVAERLGMSSDWVYRNAGRLPFTRRVGGRSLRFSSTGLSEWLRRGRR